MAICSTRAYTTSDRSGLHRHGADAAEHLSGADQGAARMRDYCTGRLRNTRAAIDIERGQKEADERIPLLLQTPARFACRRRARGQRPQVRRGPRQGREASGTKRGKKYCKRAPALTILLKGGTPDKSLKLWRDLARQGKLQATCPFRRPPAPLHRLVRDPAPFGLHLQSSDCSANLKDQ